jgi:DNA-binding SARP family transcriptional activator
MPLSPARRACYKTHMAAFKILGPLEVVGDDGPVVLGGPKQRALVALLLIHADEILSTDRIVDELWSGKPPKTATTSLWNLIAHVRKVLPADTLVTKPGGYSLQIGDNELDYRSFEQLVEEARRVDGRRRSELLQRALDIWRGPVLDDLAFESLASAEIERLNELRLQTIEEWIDVELDQGLGGELVPEVERLVRENPLRERLRGQLRPATPDEAVGAVTVAEQIDRRITVVAAGGDVLAEPPAAERRADLKREVLAPLGIADNSVVVGGGPEQFGPAVGGHAAPPNTLP